MGTTTPKGYQALRGAPEATYAQGLSSGAIQRDPPGLLMRLVYNPAPTVCKFPILPQLLLAVLVLPQLLSQLLRKFSRSERTRYPMVVLLLG